MTDWRWAAPVVGVVSLLSGVVLMVFNGASSDPSPVEFAAQDGLGNVPAQATQPLGSQAQGSRTDPSGLNLIGAIGVSEPLGQPVVVSAEQYGRISAVFVRPGQFVSEGQVLFQLDTRQAGLELEQSQSRLLFAQAALEELRGVHRCNLAANVAAIAEIESVESKLAGAKATARRATSEYRTAVALFERDAMPKQRVDQRRAALEESLAHVDSYQAVVRQTRAKLEELQNRMSLIFAKDGAAGPSMLGAQQKEAEAQRAVDQARLSFDLLSVRSPIDGRVLQVTARPGELLSVDSPANTAVVLGRRGVQLRVEIDETDVHRFHPAAQAWATPFGEPSTRVELKFLYSEPMLIAKSAFSGRAAEFVDTRVLQVIYAVEDIEQAVRVGMQFDVFIE